MACQCPGLAEFRQGCLALQGCSTRSPGQRRQQPHHTLPRTRGTGELLHHGAEGEQGLGMSGYWGPILHPHSLSPAVRVQHIPHKGRKHDEERSRGVPGSEWLAENRVRISKQLEMGNTDEEDCLSGRGRVGGCWKMAVAARTRPGGVPQSAPGIVLPAYGPSMPEGWQGYRDRRREGCHCCHWVGTPAPGLAAECCAMLVVALRHSRREERCCCQCQGHAQEWERHISG